jgi:hypothetical protein
LRGRISSCAKGCERGGRRRVALQSREAAEGRKAPVNVVLVNPLLIASVFAAARRPQPAVMASLLIETGRSGKIARFFIRPHQQ